MGAGPKGVAGPSGTHLIYNTYTILAQDIVETPRETYKGLICDPSSQRIMLGELEQPHLNDLEML
jgi:hypothetical protein